MNDWLSLLQAGRGDRLNSSSPTLLHDIKANVVFMVFFNRFTRFCLLNFPRVY